MIHSLLTGIMFGLGAAIPVGPVNLEITRRNLQLGTRFGIALGLGACTADVIYLLLLAFGALVVLQHHFFMRVIGIIGALILIWFAKNAFEAGLKPPSNVQAAQAVNSKHACKHYVSGLMMTLANPITILFWSSVGTQVAALAQHGHGVAGIIAFGVILGTVGWVLCLNSLLAITRHYLSTAFTRWLNFIGGIILLIFACVGIWHSI